MERNTDLKAGDYVGWISDADKLEPVLKHGVFQSDSAFGGGCEAVVRIKENLTNFVIKKELIKLPGKIGDPVVAMKDNSGNNVIPSHVALGNIIAYTLEDGKIKVLLSGTNSFSDEIEIEYAILDVYSLQDWPQRAVDKIDELSDALVKSQLVEAKVMCVLRGIYRTIGEKL